MKKTTLITTIAILLLLSCKSDRDWFKLTDSERQSILFNQGVKCAKKHDLYPAIRSFHSATFQDTLSFINQKSRHYIDSLLPLYRNDQTKALRGLWKLKELHYNPSPGTFKDYIEFEDSYINFYSETADSKRNLERREKISYVPYDSTDIFFEPYKMVFSNGEIWYFYLDKKQKKLKLYPTVERTKDGVFPLFLDERAIIIDKRKRKEALKKEYYTFYEQE